MHTVCAQVTEEFLAFSRPTATTCRRPPRLRLRRPRPGRPLVPVRQPLARGLGGGVAPPVFLAATHEATLAVMPVELLLDHALDAPTH